MNSIQKAATAFVALAITLVGATFVTAPLGLADMRPPALHHGVSAVAQSRTTPRDASLLQQG